MDLFNQLFGGSKTPENTPVVKDIPDRESSEAAKVEESEQPLAGADRVSLDVRVHVPSICFEILRSAASPKDEETSVARFSIHGLVVKTAMQRSSAMEMELQVQSFSIKDTRPDSGNLFQEIMPATDRKDEQLVLHLSRAATGSSAYTVTVDSPKLLLVLDHLFCVRDFFMDPDVAAAQTEGATSSADPDEVQQGAVSYRVVLSNVEIILLQDARVASTEAVVLMSKQLVVAQEVVLSIGVQEMGMFFCSMDKREETSLRFIQNFDVTMSMDDRMTGPGHRLTNILLDLSPLMLRISYKDAMLLMEIVNMYTELSARSGSAPIATAREGVENALSRESSLEEIIMARERLQASVKSIRIILIDDLNDLHLPMLDLVMDKLVVDVSDWSSHVSHTMYGSSNVCLPMGFQLRIETSPSIYINYFNVRNSHWEPFIEPWQFFITVIR